MEEELKNWRKGWKRGLSGGRIRLWEGGSKGGGVM